MNIRVNAQRAKAFTLVEVLMSVIIIGVAASGLLACFHGSFFIMRMARENQRATQILVERAEAIRVFSWTDITNGAVPPLWTNYYDESGYNGNHGTAYLISISASPTAFGTTYNQYLRQININVSWTTEGIARSRSLNTLVAYDGIQNYVY